MCEDPHPCRVRIILTIKIPLILVMDAVYSSTKAVKVAHVSHFRRCFDEKYRGEEARVQSTAAQPAAACHTFVVPPFTHGSPRPVDSLVWKFEGRVRLTPYGAAHAFKTQDSGCGKVGKYATHD